MTSDPCVAFGCYRLEMLVREATASARGYQKGENVSRLFFAAKNGDCQFNRRCKNVANCPMSKQILRPRTTKLMTESLTNTLRD